MVCAATSPFSGRFAFGLVDAAFSNPAVNGVLYLLTVSSPLPYVVCIPNFRFLHRPELFQHAIFDYPIGRRLRALSGAEDGVQVGCSGLVD